MNDSNPSTPSPTSPENFPAARQWQAWVRTDKPRLSWRWFEDLEPGAWLDLLRDGQPPDTESKCIEIISACFCIGLPKVLEEILKRSRHLIVRFRTRSSTRWRGALSPSFEAKITQVLVDELLIPQRDRLCSFDVERWDLSDDKSVHILCTGLAKCSRLEVLRLFDCKLIDTTPGRLLQSVKTSWSTLETLSFSCNPISRTSTACLVNALKAMPVLTRLKLSECFIDEPLATLLAGALEQAPVLKTIDLSHNPLGDTTGAMLITKMQHCMSLEQLDLSACGLGPESAAALSELLETRVPLKRLCLDWNDLDLPASFTHSLESNTTLHSLHIAGCGSRELVARLADSLKINRSLRQLSLHHSTLDRPDVVKSLCLMLQTSQLDTIDLGQCEFADADCAALLNALKKNSSLGMLILEGNQMKAKACDAAGELLKINNTLKRLDISRCEIDDLSLTALTRHLSRSGAKGLTRLNLSWNEIDAGGVSALLRALDSQQGLVHCSLGHNPFDLANSQVREQFDQAIKKNATLTWLDYRSFKNWDLYDWSAISKKLSTNARLSNPSTHAYLLELVNRFAFERIGFRDVGKWIWSHLRDDPHVDDRYAHLRSVLRLGEVSRGIAFGFHEAEVEQ